MNYYETKIDGNATDSMNIDLNSNINIPLVVDLDGTLTLTDTLHELAIKFFFKNPILNIFRMIFWLFEGKARFKYYLSEASEIKINLIPYNDSFINWLQSEKDAGRKLILCTGANQKIANAVAENLKIFDNTFASTKDLNLSGNNKSTFLEKEFGDSGFIYAGNSMDDMNVWKKASKSIVVNGSNRVKSLVKKKIDSFIIFPSQKTVKINWLKPLRLHQWSKNILIFLPLIAAYQQYSFENLISLIGAFICMGLCASSTYVLNDIIDLESDRLHARKKFRSFASGEIPLNFSLFMLLLLPSSIYFSYAISVNFMAIILIYVFLTISYSIFIKALVIIDCIVLAALYTIRIIAGAVVSNNIPSFWLVAFSILFFFSLAFLKRYSELLNASNIGEEMIHGRGYLSSDNPLVLSLGVASGLGSVVVMMLYLNSPEILLLYSFQEILWLTIPILLFWISYVWLQAHRGNIDDDPVIFAIKDYVSIFSAIGFFVCIFLGATGF